MNIIFAGDYYPNGEISWDAEIESIIKEADYAIVNFESPIIDKEDKKLCKYGPNLHSSPASLLPLRQLGFSCLTLANNHTLDYGSRALINTINFAKQNNFDIVGASDNLVGAQKPLIKLINKKKIAIINCCEHEFSVAQKDTPGTNPLDPIQQFNTIQSIKREVDYIIVIVHGGHEGFQLPSPRMQDTYRFFIDSGAHVVINHHQHCYSGMEKYKDGLIFYGLGNFFFPEDGVYTDRKWNEGYLLQLSFLDKTISYTLYPYLQAFGNRRLVLLHGENLKEFETRFKELNKIILDREVLERENTNWRRETQKNYSSGLAPYTNRYFRYFWSRGLLPSGLTHTKITRLLNFIECESHRDRFAEYLRSLLRK